ncbi:MAG: orotidine-5'-phosphate decarboxylase [Candidatus Omnitrophota bacterium]
MSRVKKKISKPGLILALDTGDLRRVRYFVSQLGPYVKMFKVGSQLFISRGPEVVRFIHRSGRDVFLDLKLFDIPNTVANAVREAVRHRVKMLTLHIAGGSQMLEKAALAARDESRRLGCRRPLLIGVTVLTSSKASGRAVLSMGRMGLACGLDGLVCSVREAALLRRSIKNDFIIVTPGIRPPGSAADDQKRAAGVRDAVISGSNFLVIGRPILEADDPVFTARKILKEMDSQRLQS